MLFDIHIGIDKQVDKKLIRRHAVRAIVTHNNKYLMLYCDRGDYKLPGGGIEANESATEALKRELAEETGYLESCVKEQLGNVFERRIDKYDDSCVFEMNSAYYLCSIEGQQGTQALTESETALGMKPVWVTIQTAIAANEAYLEKNKDQILWTTRELMVLKELQKAMISHE